MTGASLSSSSSSPSESDDEDEDEDGDSDGDGFIRGTSLNGVFFGTSDSSDEESEEDDEEEDEAWRRLRFLLRFRGAVGFAVGIWMVVVLSE